MRNKILGGIGIIWGGLIVLNGLFGTTVQGSEAYKSGQSAGFVFGAIMLIVGAYYFFKKNSE